MTQKNTAMEDTASAMEAQDRETEKCDAPEAGTERQQEKQQESSPEQTGEAEQQPEAAETRSDEAASEEAASSRQTEALEKAVEEWKDKYTRLYAEFDNFRKRTDREKSQMFEMGARDVIEKMLPVIDNFERAMETVQPEDKEDAFTKGVEGIFRQIQKTFQELEVQPIEALGQKFDPNLHNAVMTDTESDAEEDTITQDLQKGYTYRGQVVRHSMVKVKK